MSHATEHREASHQLSLSIRATNGAVWKTREFRSDEKVGHVLKIAVEHFVKEGAMSKGDYLLALVIGGQAKDLIDSQTLAEAGVVNESTLAILPRGPQVDG
jgi:hypothetical protein